VTLETDEVDPFVEKMIHWWEDFKMTDDGFEIKPTPMRTLPVGIEIETSGAFGRRVGWPL
jgi:hypothetical protein